jgi:LacI family transcriptional regulator
MKGRPTIKDVARKAGLSLSTVSLVLNKRQNVSDETRRKVLEVINELGYHPQRSARGLASSLSGNIGFVLTDDHFTQAEPFYTKIFLGTEFEARKHNYYVLLTTVARTVRETDEIPRFLLEQNVDGVIIAGRIGLSWIEYIRRLKLPLVLIDYDVSRYHLSSVVMDNRGGAQLVVDHLHSGGHTKIGFVGGDLDHPSIAERYSSFRETMQSRGLSVNDAWVQVDESDTRTDNGYSAMQKILSSTDRPTAIFAVNDAMAIGSIQCLKESGLRVPYDMAVVGFDNIEAGLYVEPRLTTINVHREQMGELALRRIMEMITHQTNIVTKTLAPVELVVRESCGIKTD